MANYIIDPVILKKHLPCKTEPGEFEGNYYVSLVGFPFHHSRFMGISFPFYSFEEGMHPVISYSASCNIELLYGKEFAEAMAGPRLPFSLLRVSQSWWVRELKFAYK